MFFEIEGCLYNCMLIERIYAHQNGLDEHTLEPVYNVTIEINKKTHLVYSKDFDSYDDAMESVRQIQRSINKRIQSIFGGDKR